MDANYYSSTNSETMKPGRVVSSKRIAFIVVEIPGRFVRVYRSHLKRDYEPGEAIFLRLGNDIDEFGNYYLWDASLMYNAS